MNDTPIIMRRNGIDAFIRQEYSFGRVYGCYFIYRYGAYFQFVQKLGRTHIPICGQKELEGYIEEQTKIFAKVYRLKPQRKKQK